MAANSVNRRRSVHVMGHMKFVLSFLLHLCVLCCVNAEENTDGEVYIAYMGSSHGSGREALVASHVQLLSSVLGSHKRAQQSLVYSYTYAFTGFSAFLTKEQAADLAAKPRVLSVFPDPLLMLHTTHSWDFLQMESGIPSSSLVMANNSGADTIIGLLDTGIWPESASFNDNGIGPIPSRWKGACMQGQDFTTANCNRKLIGARYYTDSSSDPKGKSKPIWSKSMTPRDTQGHGTHTASTAAGNIVENADYYGIANGTAKGGCVNCRIAIYRVCSEDGCQGSQILAGFDDAVNDGVDILSISLGTSSFFQLDFISDPIAIGAFHAVDKGILVVCSAGNDGPYPQTVVNAAPWIFTIGASTIDRDFESNVVLGNGKTITGEAINFSNLSISDMHQIVFAGNIPGNSRHKEDSSHCQPGSLDASKAKGKLILCLNTGSSFTRLAMKKVVQDAGGIGMILVEDSHTSSTSNYGTFPSTSVTNKSGTEILSYIASTRNPVATILPTVTVTDYKPAPVVAYFSSRGPGARTENILKPDISAPGVNILAAWIPVNRSSDTAPAREKPSAYYLASGTSMACPHVSGAAAFLKSNNPTWSPSVIRSALITTATPMNNMGQPMTNDSDILATAFDYGAGEINPLRALQPGLVYESTSNDYLLFLCNYGYNSSQIKTISGVNDSFNCPSDSKDELISNMNYPTIAISKLELNGSKTITRTVTNLGSDKEATYKLSIDVPTWLNVNVSPDELHFSNISNKLSFTVIFSPSKGATTKGYAFGAFTWIHGEHNVRTPFAVNIV